MQSPAVRQRQQIQPQSGLLWLICLFSLVKFAIPFLLQDPVYEPHRDEFLYLAEGRHLAWGYLEVPPLLSVLTAITNGLGGGFFWIKFWPALFGAFTYALAGRMVLLLGGGRFALLLAFLPFVFGYLLHVHFMLQPNFLEVFFWTLMVYGLVRWINGGRVGGLYLAGIGFGLGMLSKYSVLLFTGSLLLGLLLTPERKVFRNRHFYFALLVGFGLFLPNGIWQAMHGWPVMTHMQELRQQQLTQVDRLHFVEDQLAYNLPGLIIWVAGLFWLFGTKAGKPYRFAGWAVLLTLGLLAVAQGKSYYAMGVYPILFGFGAVALERMTATRPRVWRYGLVLFSLGVGCMLDTVVLPMLPPARLAAFYVRNPVFRRLGFLRWEDQRDHALPQDFADMLGWEEMALKAAKAYESLDSLEKSAVLLNSGGNYGESGALDYYTPKYSLPPVMGRGANYALWAPAGFYDRDVFIVITDDRSWVHGEYMKKFAYAAIVDSITHPYARELGTYFILMKGPDAEVRQHWKTDYKWLRRMQLAAR